MPGLFAAATIALSLVDHWTTWLCLRAPVAGWEVVERNPLAAWLFDSAGLVPGLALDFAATGLAVAFIYRTTHVGNAGKCALLGVASAATGFAVINNAHAVSSLGISTASWGV